MACNGISLRKNSRLKGIAYSFCHSELCSTHCIHFLTLPLQSTTNCIVQKQEKWGGWSGKGLDPKDEAFLRPPGWGALRLCQHRAEYMVPCSRQSPFPYLCSAPLRCGQWMPILGDPGVHEMGIPSRNGDPQQHIWKALPHPCQEPTPAANGPPTPPRAFRFRSGPAGLPAGSQPHWRPPGAQQGPTTHPQRAESRPVQPRFTPPWVRSRRVSSRSGHLREHYWEALPHPRQEPTPALRRPGSPRPCRAPGALPTFTSGSR